MEARIEKLEKKIAQLQRYSKLEAELAVEPRYSSCIRQLDDGLWLAWVPTFGDRSLKDLVNDLKTVGGIIFDAKTILLPEEESLPKNDVREDDFAVRYAHLVYFCSDDEEKVVKRYLFRVETIAKIRSSRPKSPAKVYAL